MNQQKRLVSIQDISCTGRCSLTVALPIISSAGIETAVIPTAVLSTHTGGFTGYTFRDLTDDFESIENHWQTLNRPFDAIYTGYLAPRQVDLVKDFVKKFKKENTLVLIDPAMADGGKMYPGFDLEFAKKMAGLVAMADITVPNLTEACFMLGIDYPESYDKEFIHDVLLKLSDLGPRYAVLSGVSYNKGKVGVECYDGELKTFTYFETTDVKGYFHGAGDIFASALISGLLNGLSIGQSCYLAHDMVHSSILNTLKDQEDDMKFGLHFEKAIPDFIEEIKDRKSGKLVDSIFD